MVPVPTEFLVSAGQSLTVGVSITSAEPGPEPGERLRRRNAELNPASSLYGWPVPRVVIAHTWDQTYIPSDRKLWEILEDVARHGIENSSHGVDCLCMDQFAREIKLHVSRAVPPDTGENGDVRHRVDARQRVAHILAMVSRWL